MNKSTCVDEVYNSTRSLMQVDPVVIENEVRQSSKLEKKPLVSIITIVYNGEKYLEETIQSVIIQTFDNVEYIIIDGGSTDGTLDIIKKYNEQIDYWVSEKDAGIYDAMNKGILHVSGDFVQFLNAGDSFFNQDSLSELVYNIKDRDSIYFARAYTYNDTISWLYPSKKKESIDQWLKKGSFPNHQTMFFPRVFYKKNLYDTSYKITSDIDYKYRAYYKYPYVFVDMIVVKFSLGGISTQNENFDAIMQRIRESIRRNIKYRLYTKLVTAPIIIFSKYILAKVFGKNINLIIKLVKGYRS